MKTNCKLLVTTVKVFHLQCKRPETSDLWNLNEKYNELLYDIEKNLSDQDPHKKTKYLEIDKLLSVLSDNVIKVKKNDKVRVRCDFAFFFLLLLLLLLLLLFGVK